MTKIHLISLPIIALCLTGGSCATTSAGYPAREDVIQSVAPKPVPGEEILTPEGNARYNERVETWGDGISRAAARMCRFFHDRGMKVECPARPTGEE